MFREIILPIFRTTRLCVTACGIGRQHRGCIIPQAVTHRLVFLKMGKVIARNMLSWLELLMLLLHLVGCLYYLYQWCTVKQISDNEIYLLFKYIKSVLWRVAKRPPCIEDARCLKVKWRTLHDVRRQLLPNKYRNQRKVVRDGVVWCLWCYGHCEGTCVSAVSDPPDLWCMKNNMFNA